MRLRTRFTAAAAIALLALLPAAGAAQASTAVDRPPLTAQCDAYRAGNVIVVTGHARSPGATSVFLECSVYVNGSPIGSFSATSAGPVVNVAGVITNAPPGSLGVCTEASDGFTHFRSCGGSAR